MKNIFSMIALILVIVLVIISITLVLDLASSEQLKETLTKMMAIIAILGVASIVVSLLTKGK